MILQESLTKDWIKSFREKAKYRKADPAITEKMVFALYLLESLVNTGFKFVFKGGTSLVLLLDETIRFSIDIDIITEHKLEELEQSLDLLIENSHFIKWEKDEKRSFVNKIPKAHYEFFYNSEYNQNAYIILDVLFEKHQYPELTEKSIKTEWLLSEEPYVKVTVPTIESILGDKLTAFAPNTTGIPYNKGKDLQIIKQLFDQGNRF